MTTRPKAPGSRAPRERGTGSITSYPTKGGLRWRFEILAPVDPSRPEQGARKHSRGGFASHDDADERGSSSRAPGFGSGSSSGCEWGDLDFNKSEMRIQRALHCDETMPLASDS